MIISFVLFVLSFIYRLFGISYNHPFWVDEFSTAKAARHILQHGFGYFTNPNIDIEFHNITTYSVAALFFKLFGENEWSARLPFVIIGSLLPIGVFFLAKKLSNQTAAICAGLLTTFSYLMIVWSTQARGYVLFQLLALLSIYTYIGFLKKRDKTLINYLLLILPLSLIVLTHLMGYILIGTIIIHFVWIERNTIIKNLSIPKYIVSTLILVLIVVSALWKQGIINYFFHNFSITNNLWYYHSFLWREYGLVTFMGFFGLIIAYFKKQKEISIVLLYMAFHLLFTNFIWGHHMTKYILVIFPFLFIGMGFFISEVATLIIDQHSLNNRWKKQLKITIPIIVILFVIVNGDKFVLKPKQYYSLNKNFREIANIDYNQIYQIIKERGNIQERKTAIVETWTDRAQWYLGNDYPGIYLFRWQNEKDIVNGHLKITPFTYNKKGEKIRATKEKTKFIGELSDLKKVLAKYPQGFFLIDDLTYPREVIEYVEKNFKKELYLDHYPLDDNPYSIWPANLYSWGIN